MQMICILLGVPESERHWLFEAIEPQFDFGGSRKASVGQMSAEEAGTRMYTYGQELIAAKRAEPTDDMLSVVANATLDDGTPAVLSELELYLFFSLLFSAGAETTRNAVAGGLLALAEHPDQLAVAARGPVAVADRRRGDGALDVAVAVEAAHRHPRRRVGRMRDRGRAEGADLGGLGQPRRGGVRRPRHLRHRAGSPTRTWVSVRASTTASAPTWPGWSCGCCSRSCSAGSRRSGSSSRWSGHGATGTPASVTSSSNWKRESLTHSRR